MPRFPVRIELNRFVAALGAGEVSSLFGWLLELMRRRTERDLYADDLRAWLKAWPWLLVLDGLDEVPTTSNRRGVLDAVHDFLVDANDCNADLLLVATSRPQGYNDDFSPRYYVRGRIYAGRSATRAEPRRVRRHPHAGRGLAGHPGPGAAAA
jgi:predicted NACHT family NTPase